MRGSALDELVERGVISRSTRNPVSDEIIQHHVRLALARNLPEVEERSRHERTMVIAGNGPSLREIEPVGDIFALGGAHDWLIENGIVPHAWVNADPLPWIANYLKNPHPEVTYYLASHSHKFVFEALEGMKVVLWHNNVGAGTEQVVMDTPNHMTGKVRWSIAGGCTGATRTLRLGGEVLGYRKFIFYGVDGSGGHTGAFQRKGDEVDVTVGGKTYSVPRGFCHQALHFLRDMRAYPEWDIEFRGSGFMAAFWEKSRQQRADPGKRQIQHEAGVA